MAKSNPLTVFTVVSSVLALQACSEGITAASEALSNLPSQTSSEATDPSVITLGAANPIGTQTTIPITPSTTSNYIINNFTVLPTPLPPPFPNEELEPNLAAVIDLEPETDSEVVTDLEPETDSEVVIDLEPETDSEVVIVLEPETDSKVVTDLEPETDSEVVTDLEPETDSEVVTDITRETSEKEVANVDYTPVLEAPAEGELVPFGSTIQFAWSIPAALLGTVTGFDIAIADTSEGVVSYRDSIGASSSCREDGVCTHEINSADLPIPEGDNIWSVSSLGDNVSVNTAEATFTLDKAPETKIASGLNILSPAAGYIADSSSVDFTWQDLSKPDAVYDLHVYSDAARTQKVTGTNGVIFDTSGIGTGTSYTFTNDPSNGEMRYALLSQWKDTNYDPESRQEILFEYTAHKTKNKVVASGADFYGSAIGIRSLSNTPIDDIGKSGRNEKEASVGFTYHGKTITGAKTYHIFRPNGGGYSAGDGGIIRYALQADDGTGRPDGTNIVISAEFVALPALHASQAAAASRYPGAIWSSNGETGTSLDRFRKIDFLSVANVVPGQRYHIVMQNTTPDSANHWISLNGNVFGPDGNYSKNIVRSEDPNYSPGDGEIWAMDSAGVWVRRRGTVAIYEVYGDVVQGNTYYELSSTLDNESGDDRTFNVSGRNKARESITPVAAGQLCKTGVMAGRQSGSGALNLEIKQGGVVLFSQALKGFPTVASTDNVVQISEKSAFVEIVLPNIPIAASPDVYFEYSTDSSTSYEMTMQLDGAKIGFFEGSKYSGSKNTHAEVSTDGVNWDYPVNYSTPSSAVDLSFYAKTCQ